MSPPPYATLSKASEARDFSGFFLILATLLGSCQGHVTLELGFAVAFSSAEAPAAAPCAGKGTVDDAGVALEVGC